MHFTTKYSVNPVRFTTKCRINLYVLQLKFPQVLSKGTSGFLGSFITETGSWWGTEQLTEPNGNLIRKPADIDVVGLSRSERSIVIGECKFKNDPIDKTVFDTLVRRGNSMTKKYTISKYLLFSLNGFTNWFDTVNDDRLMTFTLEDLY